LDLGCTAGKPLGHWLSSPCPVFLLFGSDGSILALLVIPYEADGIPHLLLNLHISLQDLVGSCTPITLQGVVGFGCCPNPGLEHCSSAVSQGTFLFKQKEKTLRFVLQWKAPKPFAKAASTYY